MASAGAAEGVEGAQPVGMHMSGRGEAGVAECPHSRGGEAADHLHGDTAHAPAGMPLGGGDDAGFASRTRALVALAAEIDIVCLDHRGAPASAPASARTADKVAALALGHGMAQALVQIP